MLLTETSKAILFARRERRRMEAAGYRMVEVDWSMHRGARMDHKLVDVQIAYDGKSVWFKTEQML